MDNVKISVTLDKFKLELEGPRDYVDEKLAYFAEIIEMNKENVVENSGPSNPHPSDGSQNSTGTLKNLIEIKKPGNSSEAIACCLFFFKNERKQEEVSTEEIRKSLMFAKFKTPANFGQALTDCKGKYGYIDNGAQKGLWKLTHEGESVVEFDLPKIK